MKELKMTIDITNKVGDEYKSIRVEVGEDGKGSWNSSGYEALEAMPIFKEIAELTKAVHGFQVKKLNDGFR